MLLCFLPHDNGTWEAKQNQNTIGAAVSSAADTQTEDSRLLLTSARSYVQDQSKFGDVHKPASLHLTGVTRVFSNS